MVDFKNFQMKVNPDFSINGSINDMNELNLIDYENREPKTIHYKVPMHNALFVSYSYKMFDGFSPRKLPPRFLIYGYLDEE